MVESQQSAIPSEVVKYIDLSLPKLLRDRQNGINLEIDNVSPVAGLVALIDQIPARLLTFTPTDYCRWTGAVVGLRFGLEVAAGVANLGAAAPIYVAASFGVNPVVAIREHLNTCPDELPRLNIAGLEFIKDSGQRDDLRMDIDRLRDAFARSDFKSATVLAGAAIEALLLWGILESGAAQWQPIALATKGSKWVQDKGDPENWTLGDYLIVAPDLGIISKETVVQCKLAQDFRNLIHPGRMQRLQMKCDRATALSGEAGLEHVIRDLTAKFL